MVSALFILCTALKGKRATNGRPYEHGEAQWKTNGLNPLSLRLLRQTPAGLPKRALDKPPACNPPQRHRFAAP